MSNTIVLEPFGGLANRMGVIASGLWMGSKLKKEVKLIWNLESNMNCSFEELFEPIANLELINKKFRYRFLRSGKSEQNIKSFIKQLFNNLLTNNYIILEDEDANKIRRGLIDLKELSGRSKTPYFITCKSFGNNTNELKFFMPVADIQRKIDFYSQGFNDKTIGVHIRRTDNIHAIKHSPTNLFIKRMLSRMENDSETTFFLSTDDPKTESKLKDLFGHNLLTIEKNYSRNKPEGIKDAAVDLFCLSKTNKIFGSYWSSFSQMAAQISGVKLEIIK